MDETLQDVERPRKLEPSTGWRWLKPGRAEGPLVAGCLESLQHLRGTRFWPNWRDAIFFFETSGEGPMPDALDAILMDYENMGVLHDISGLLVGRPTGYSPSQKQELDQVLLERTKQFDFPIVTNMDFGHTAPQLTLPIGCRGVIDTATKTVAVTESAVG